MPIDPPTDHARQQRRNSQYGAFFFMLGLVMVFFGATFGFQASMHFFILNMTPSPPRDVGFEIWRQANLIMMTSWPVLMLGGLIYAISGFHIRRHSAAAIRIAYWTTLAGFGLGAANMLRTTLILFGSVWEQVDNQAELLAIRIAVAIFTAGLYFGPPTLFLWMLRRVRAVDAVTLKTDAANGAKRVYDDPAGAPANEHDDATD